MTSLKADDFYERSRLACTFNDRLSPLNFVKVEMFAKITRYVEERGPAAVDSSCKSANWCETVKRKLRESTAAFDRHAICPSGENN